MYSVSKEMPLQSYAIINPSENQTDFTPGQIIRWTIPRNIGFFDSHLSFAQFNVRTSGANYKMCFSSPKAGIASMVDMVRISQGGRVLSEITEYATLQHFIKTYENSLSVEQVQALGKGCVDYGIGANTLDMAGSYNALLGQGLNRSGESGATAMEQDVKFQLTLDFIALFEILHVVPVMAMGDLLIELRLADSDHKIMKVLPASQDTFTLSAAATTGDVTLTLAPPFVGFTNLADSPFIVGQSITPNIGPETAITSLSQAESTGVISIGIGALAVASNGAVSITITKGADGNADPNVDTSFIVSSSVLQLQVVKPPDQYVQDVARQVESGQMIIDMDSYTTYRSNILAGIKNQTVTLPTTQARAKAFFSVPRKGNQVLKFETNGSKDFDFNGKWVDLKSYRTQIDGQYYPNQPVDLTMFQGNWSYPQEHVRELEKSFDAAGLPYVSLESLKQNFVIGRALSSYGSSTNLTGTPINLYVEYNTAAGTDPAETLDVVSFLHHTVRIAISPMGIEILS
jgi:hypothetical protein